MDTQKFSCNKIAITLSIYQSVGVGIAIMSAIIFCFLIGFAFYKRHKWHYNWDVPDADTARLNMEKEMGIYEDFGYGLIGHKKELKEISYLGAGNFGVVNKAILRRRGARPARLVAVKKLEHGNATDMIEEARMMSEIPRHYAVVQMLGICEDPPCLVLEFVDGIEDFDEHMLRIQIQPESDHKYLTRAVMLLSDISAGLAFLHSKSFVHRDIAPRNMLVRVQDGDFIPRAKVGDFGQARKLKDGSDFTEYSDQIYDRNLLAPENYLFNGYHSKKSDVYQLGKTIWETFTHHLILILILILICR